MKALADLQELGYDASLEGDRIRLAYRREGEPDPAKVTPLLEAIRQHKAEAIRELQKRQDTDKARTPATLAEAEENGNATFPGTEVIPTRHTLSPAGWRRAFGLCPPGDRDRLEAFFMSGSVEAVKRGSEIFLHVTTPEGATVELP